MNTILIAENNKDFAYVIHWYFTNKGYVVFSAGNGSDILDLYETKTPDLILLDINLDGEIDGKEVAKRIRNKNKKTPILFMSGENNSPADVVEAFGIGGNYFIKKPVSIEELEAHILSALKISVSTDYYHLNSFDFNVKERTITKDGKIIESLTEKETLVLQILIENSNNIVETFDILNLVWGTDDKEESLRNSISSLRKKIMQTDASIDTIKGKGYRFIM